MTARAQLAFALLPFEDTRQVELDHLAQDLAAAGVATARRLPIELPEYAFDARRSQYHAEALLRRVASAPATRLIGS